MEERRGAHKTKENIFDFLSKMLKKTFMSDYSIAQEPREV
jgi:hypothetical protein